VAKNKEEKDEGSLLRQEKWIGTVGVGMYSPENFERNGVAM
jgi:hypothetical protein